MSICSCFCVYVCSQVFALIRVKDLIYIWGNLRLFLHKMIHRLSLDMTNLWALWKQFLVSFFVVSSLRGCYGSLWPLFTYATDGLLEWCLGFFGQLHDPTLSLLVETSWLFFDIGGWFSLICCDAARGYFLLLKTVYICSFLLLCFWSTFPFIEFQHLPRLTKYNFWLLINNWFN